MTAVEENDLGFEISNYDNFQMLNDGRNYRKQNLSTAKIHAGEYKFVCGRRYCYCVAGSYRRARHVLIKTRRRTAAIRLTFVMHEDQLAY